ncbi:MAG: SAM-dependent methyltransferase, partial [bacterium]
EQGAKHVIILENSQHIDGIARKSTKVHENIDTVQCSLEALPFKLNSFSGLITCNDVLQHAASFDNSLKSLWGILKNKGEIVLSCPVRQSKRWYHKVRYKAVNIGLRRFLSARSVHVTKQYSRVVSLLHLLPLMNILLIKNKLVHRTTKPSGHFCMHRRYKDAFHHTFEYFAGHKHEHLKTEPELKQLIEYLQKNPLYIKNGETFFQNDRPLGLALRMKKVS